MPYYRRLRVPGGTYFFTIVTENRAPLFADERWRGLLRTTIDAVRRERPFGIEAIVLLPDHLHMLMTLPADDADFSTRLSALKAGFTHEYLAAGGAEQARSAARVRKRRRGVWQRWFWEHLIRDADDLRRHVEYIHFNPVRHGLARCPHEWPWSSFGKYVERAIVAADCACACHGRTIVLPEMAWGDACEPPD